MRLCGSLALVPALLLLCLGACGVCAATKPAFQARITQHALDYVNHQAVSSLVSKVKTIRIPDQSGESGHVSYSLTNNRISHFSPPSSRLRLIPDKGVSWSASNIDVLLQADWTARYRHGWIHFSMSGSVDATFSDVTFSANMSFGSDSTGRLSVKSGGCRCNVGRVGVNIHGDMHEFLNMFRGEVEKKVKAILPDKLCEAATDLINNNAQNQLSKVRVMAPVVDKLFLLDYRMVSPPSFQHDYMETFLKGDITWASDPEPLPFSPAPLPPAPSSSKMLYVWMGEYMPQSFAYTAQTHGFLQYDLGVKDLPSMEKDYLNTSCSVDPEQSTVMTCMGLMFPQVSKKYPHRTVTLRMNSTRIPVISMRPALLEVLLDLDIGVYVETDHGSPPYLFTLSVSAVLNTTVAVQNQMIKVKITGSSFKVTVLDSAIGPLKSSVVDTLVGFALKFFIIPKFNEKGGHGVPLPIIEGVQFINTELQVMQDAMIVATDLVYKPVVIIN